MPPFRSLDFISVSAEAATVPVFRLRQLGKVVARTRFRRSLEHQDRPAHVPLRGLGNQFKVVI